MATTSTSETASESEESNQSAQLLSENPVVTPASLPSMQENPAPQVSLTLVTSIPKSESPVPCLSQTGTVIPASEIATVAPEIPAVTAKASTTSGYLNNQCNFQMEKPKLPKFSGDVRDYAIFKADFKHVVETRYGKRDAITILRTSLQGKPLDMIKGIGQDYDAAWEYLDSVYGDPRYVADMITQDITRFKPIKDSEDSRFCDLVHLVRQSYNTLKEVGRANDMNNNHMLALIEQKMLIDDRKVWARHLESVKSQATLGNMLLWMTSEMKSRMRAIVPLRSSSQKSNISNVSEREGHQKCMLCKEATHWTDQCQKFLAMNPVD